MGMKYSGITASEGCRTERVNTYTQTGSTSTAAKSCSGRKWHTQSARDWHEAGHVWGQTQLYMNQCMDHHVLFRL